MASHRLVRAVVIHGARTSACNVPLRAVNRVTMAAPVSHPMSCQTRHFAFKGAAQPSKRGTRKTQEVLNFPRKLAEKKDKKKKALDENKFHYRKSPMQRLRAERVKDGVQRKKDIKQAMQKEIDEATEDYRFMTSRGATRMKELRRAAKNGDAKAQFNLGCAYAPAETFNHVGTYLFPELDLSITKQDEDLVLAEKWLTRAAAQGHGAANFYLYDLCKYIKLPTLTEDDAEGFLRDALSAMFPAAHYYVMAAMYEAAENAPDIGNGEEADRIADEAFQQQQRFQDDDVKNLTEEELKSRLEESMSRTSQSARYLAGKPPTRMELLSTLRAHATILIWGGRDEQMQGEYMLMCANVFMQGIGGPVDHKMARLALERGTMINSPDCAQALGMVLLQDGDMNGQKLIDQVEKYRENARQQEIIIRSALEKSGYGLTLS